jgi:transcriptional regulator with XRE-family HTH domain
LKQRHSQRHATLQILLRDARIKAGLTQQQLADRLKRSDNFVSYVETGERMLDVLEFIDYAAALGMDPKKLLGKLLA